MTRIRIELTLHENHVLTAVRFYLNRDNYLESQISDPSLPSNLLDWIGEKKEIGSLVEYVRERLNECGKTPIEKAKPFEGLDGAFTLLINTSFDKEAGYAELDVTQARHSRLNGGGKDIVYAFAGGFKMRVLANIFRLIRDRDVVKLNAVLSALREAV